MFFSSKKRKHSLCLLHSEGSVMNEGKPRQAVPNLSKNINSLLSFGVTELNLNKISPSFFEHLKWPIED